MEATDEKQLPAPPSYHEAVTKAEREQYVRRMTSTRREKVKKTHSNYHSVASTAPSAPPATLLGLHDFGEYPDDMDCAEADSAPPKSLWQSFTEFWSTESATKDVKCKTAEFDNQKAAHDQSHEHKESESLWDIVTVGAQLLVGSLARFYTEFPCRKCGHPTHAAWSCRKSAAQPLRWTRLN